MSERNRGANLDPLDASDMESPAGVRVRRRGRPPGALPFSSRITELRLLRGWTQEELADSAGWDPKVISRSECWKRINPSALRNIASTLGVGYFEVVVPDLFSGADPQAWLAEVQAADMAGDEWKARKLAETIVGNLITIGHPLRHRACVQLAIVCAHQRAWERAIEVIEGCLREAANAAGDQRHLLAHPELRWATYQRGVIQCAYAQDLLARTGGFLTPRIRQLLGSAREDFERCVRAEPDALTVASTHQRGVCLLCEGRVTEALELFRKCLAQRLAAHAGDDLGAIHRLAYEHRRIASCCRLLAAEPSCATTASYVAWSDAADEHLATARRQAREVSHERLLKELARDEDAWRPLD